MSKFGNMMDIMKNAKKIQEMMQEAQEELKTIFVTGESGAGMVKITMNARYAISKIEISDEIRQEQEPDVLEDLLIAAFNDAVKKVEKISKEKMMGGAGDMLGGLGNLDDLG